MLGKKGFDLWADGYDTSVGIADDNHKYPFAGYKEVLGTIFQIIMERPGASVLDIGFGTGTLTKKLYEMGFVIYGQDFSSRMIELAQEKMPKATFYQGDFTKGLVTSLQNRRYDYIVATYSLHHLPDEEKPRFLLNLRDYLAEDGKILIGDVAFQNREKLNRCRAEAGDEWDEEECYFVVDELRKFFPDLSFQKLSYCAGVLLLS